MKHDPKIAGTILAKPRAKTPVSRERWRDEGNGDVKCENTGRVAKLTDIRRVPAADEHVVRFTDAEWKKLQELAAARSTSKKTFTPEDCLRGFIASCQPGGSDWVHPTKEKKADG